MNQIEARDQLHHVISTAIGMEDHKNSSISNSDIDDIVEKLLPQWRQETPIARSSTQVNAFLPFKYVIPDQDLKLLESITAVLAAGAGANFFMTALHFDPTKGVASAITGVFIAILHLGNKLKLATHLKPFEYEILVLLRKNNVQGHSEAELVYMIGMNFKDVTDEDIHRSMEMMSAYPTSNGTKSILVWKDSEDRWHTNV